MASNDNRSLDQSHAESWKKLVEAEIEDVEKVLSDVETLMADLGTMQGDDVMNAIGAAAGEIKQKWDQLIEAFAEVLASLVNIIAKFADWIASVTENVNNIVQSVTG